MTHSLYFYCVLYIGAKLPGCVWKQNEDICFSVPRNIPENINGKTCGQWPVVNGSHHMMFALPESVHQASTVLLSRCLESAPNVHRIIMKHTILLCPPLFAAALQTLLKKNPPPWWQQVPPAQIQHRRAGTDMGECASVCMQRQDHLATSIVTGVLSPAVCYCTQHASVCLFPGLSGKTVTKVKSGLCVVLKTPCHSPERKSSVRWD